MGAVGSGKVTALVAERLETLPALVYARFTSAILRERELGPRSVG
jgi:hypothetical protein